MINDKNGFQEDAYRPACCPYLPACTARGGCTCLVPGWGTYSLGVYLPGRVYLPGGVPAWSWGVYLVPGGVYLPRGGMYLPRGVPGWEVPAWSQGGTCLVLGVYLVLWGCTVPAQGVYLMGVYLPRGYLPGARGCTWSCGCVHAGGMYMPRVVPAWSWGVYLVPEGCTCPGVCTC